MLAPCFSLALFFAPWALFLVGPSRMGSGQITVARKAESKRIQAWNIAAGLQNGWSLFTCDLRKFKGACPESTWKEDLLAGGVGAPNGFWKTSSSKTTAMYKSMRWLSLCNHGLFQHCSWMQHLCYTKCTILAEFGAEKTGSINCAARCTLDWMLNECWGTSGTASGAMVAICTCQAGVTQGKTYMDLIIGTT